MTALVSDSFLSCVNLCIEALPSLSYPFPDFRSGVSDHSAATSAFTMAHTWIKWSWLAWTDVAGCAASWLCALFIVDCSSAEIRWDVQHGSEACCEVGIAVSCMATRWQAWSPHNSLRLRAGLGCVAHDFAEAWQADSWNDCLKLLPWCRAEPAVAVCFIHVIHAIRCF